MCSWGRLITAAEKACSKCGDIYYSTSLKDGLCFNCQVEQRRQLFRSEIGLESSQEVL
ncbi:hypothetical protein [Methanolobus chelungpuianus]|uniref:hypothetical protein n=1 Tax=Methanolobus chelungpuianus TaxID=502115 RepID=UPI002114BAA8|nr:hypothetical protein [Methanolobus chelungpuianus]